VQATRRVAGGPTESIFQPEWGANGALYFVSDASGYWNLWRAAAGTTRPLRPEQAEFGLPLWNLGMSTYAVLSDGRLLCSWVSHSHWHLGLLDPESGALEPIVLPYTELSNLRVSGERAVLGAAGPSTSPCLVELDLHTRRHRVLRRFSEVEIDPAYVSEPRALTFPTSDGKVSHALYYAPKSPVYASVGPSPLLVKSHGGPTAAASTALNLRIQYYTSRGIGVLDVDYRGSTGYGREYRGQLDGRWGVADVDDCVHGASYLCERGEADPARLMISGGSAGGFTTLAALTFRKVFKAGASHYGVSDLEALARDTHKFESRYLDRLIGPYPAREDLYRARSPLHHAAQLECPVVFFQGLEDRVVPPSQTEAMVEALRRKRIPVAYVPFAGEHHGFRRAENIRRAIEAELAFFARVLGFELADALDIDIENL
ncbi:MAG: prolyl oligopeptidase family serine peptidase, partial [Polyangiales bacterium]